MGTLVRISTKSKIPGEYGIPKLSVDEAAVTTIAVGDDYNEYRRTAHNNSAHRAVLLYTTDKITELNGEGWPMKAGDIGENFTIDGITYNKFGLGTKFSVGEVELEVSEACTPCYKLAGLSYVGKENKGKFIKTMKGRRGWYASVLKEGSVKVGDPVQIHEN